MVRACWRGKASSGKEESSIQPAAFCSRSANLVDFFPFCTCGSKTENVRLLFIPAALNSPLLHSRFIQSMHTIQQLC